VRARLLTAAGGGRPCDARARDGAAVNGTRTVVALVPYPLSSGYRGALEEELGATPQYLSLAELRRRRPLDVLRMLTSLRGCFCVLPLETEDAARARAKRDAG